MQFSTNTVSKCSTTFEVFVRIRTNVTYMLTTDKALRCHSSIMCRKYISWSKHSHSGILFTQTCLHIFFLIGMLFVTVDACIFVHFKVKLFWISLYTEYNDNEGFLYYSIIFYSIIFFFAIQKLKLNKFCSLHTSQKSSMSRWCTGLAGCTTNRTNQQLRLAAVTGLFKKP